MTGRGRVDPTLLVVASDGAVATEVAERLERALAAVESRIATSVADACAHLDTGWTGVGDATPGADGAAVDAGAGGASVESDGRSSDDGVANASVEANGAATGAGDAAAASDGGVDCVIARHDDDALDALELLATVRERRPSLPFVVVTDGDSDALVREALDAGVTAVHDETGPGGGELLAHRVRRALAAAGSAEDPVRSYARFGRLLAHESDYILVLDEAGTIKYATPAVERVLGYEPSAVIGEPVFAFIHPADEASAAADLAELLAKPGAELTGELRGRHRNGTWRHLEARARNFLDDPAIRGVVVNVRDVTDRESHVETLTALHEASRDLVTAPTREAVCEGVITIARGVIDLPHATVFLLDEASGRLVPTAIAQVLEDGYGPPPTFDPGEGIVGTVFETGESVLLADASEDDRALDRDAAADWIRGYIALTLGEHGVVTFASPEVEAFDRTDFDIANILAANATVALDQLASQAELARQRDLFARAQTIARVGAWEYDATGDRLIWSEETARIFELPAEADAGPDAVIERFHREDRLTAREAFRRAVEYGEPFDLELRLTGSDRRQRWVRMRGDPQVEDGDVTRVRGTLNVITEKKENERHLDVLDRLLRHNVRNEMTVIRGLAETIQDDVDGDVATQAAQIVEGCDTLLQSMEKEREIVKILTGSSTRRPVDVAEMVRETVAVARAIYPSASISMNGPETATATATENLAVAIEELVENAVSHGDRTDQTIELSIEVDGSAVRLRVADDGPGIPDHDKAVIAGDREVQDLYHGSGIGLWLVDWIVRRSNGSLQFDDRDPRGTIVTIELPRE